MSTVTGGQGNIVTNGLILNLDAANPRSYAPPFNGTTWQNLVAVSSSLTGSLVNGVGYTGSNGGSIVFDGTNDYVAILPTVIGSSFALQNFTIDVWIKPSTLTGDKNLWSIDYTSHSPPYYSQHMRVQSNFIFVGANITGSYDNKTWMNTSASNDQSVISLLNSNTIYNVTWVKNSNPNQHNLYINGTFICSRLLSSGNINYYSSPVRFGVANYGASYSGNYYSLKYYNRSLSSSEILQNFNATRARFGV